VVTDTRAYGRVKRGWGINAEQALTQDLGAFVRWSWDDGKTETWVFTEVDRSITAGLSLKGTIWGRAKDRVGLAYIQNGLAPDHIDYLAAGGLGFIIGDGRLNYAPERLIESYYAVSLGRFFTATLDAQRVWNPGYNRDRGPAWVAGFRLHVEGSLAFWQHDTP
jgi:carbohydrate-selective porin OprB